MWVKIFGTLNLGLNLGFSLGLWFGFCLSLWLGVVVIFYFQGGNCVVYYIRRVAYYLYAWIETKLFGSYYGAINGGEGRWPLEVRCEMRRWVFDTLFLIGVVCVVWFTLWSSFE